MCVMRMAVLCICAIVLNEGPTHSSCFNYNPSSYHHIIRVCVIVLGIYLNLKIEFLLGPGRFLHWKKKKRKRFALCQSFGCDGRQQRGFMWSLEVIQSTKFFPIIFSALKLIEPMQSFRSVQQLQRSQPSMPFFRGQPRLKNHESKAKTKLTFA